jgi:hypothetical protein
MVELVIALRRRDSGQRSSRCVLLIAKSCWLPGRETDEAPKTHRPVNVPPRTCKFQCSTPSMSMAVINHHLAWKESIARTNPPLLFHRIPLGPIPGLLLPSPPISPQLLCNPPLHRIIRVWLPQQLPCKLQDRCNLGRWLPLLGLEHAKTHHASVGDWS